MAGVQLCVEFLPCDLLWPSFSDFVELFTSSKNLLSIPPKISPHIDWSLWWFDRKWHPQGVALLAGVALFE